MKQKQMVKQLVILAVVLSFAQLVVYSDIGIKIGFQRADFEEKNGFNISSYKVGVFYTFKLGKNVTLQPELYFSHLGTRSYLTSYYEPLDDASVYYSGPQFSRETLNYIELPLLVKYVIPLSGQLRPVVFGGGYFAIRVSKNYASHYISFVNEDAIFNPPIGVNTIYAPHTQTDSGLVTGLGLEHMGRKIDMHFDLRVNIGVPNVYAKASGIKKRNLSLAFMVGVSF